jgi:hypothetical protein
VHLGLWFQLALQPIREQLPTFIVTLDFLQRRRNASTERVDQSAD